MNAAPPPDAQEIAELFHRLEPLDCAAREWILEEECRDKPELRREVEELLAALPEGEAMFGKPPVGVTRMLDSLQGFLLQGGLIGPFVVEEPLAGSGMGLVVRARDTRTGGFVALKLLAPELSGEPEWQRRFVREAAALRSLKHPGVVKFLEAGEDRGLSYFTMELIEGENLRQRMARGRPSLAESIAWTRGILDAVGAAHSAGFLHGDLKPENIMLDKDGHIRLLDFGLTRSLAPNVPATQTASVVTGTIQYLSPERVAGASVGVRSDLFSVGVLFHEFLSGSAPFARANPLATAAAILHEPPDPLPDGIPEELTSIVQTCLEKDAARRPESAAAVMRKLEQVRDWASPPAWKKRWLALRVAGAIAVVLSALAAWQIVVGVRGAGSIRVSVPGTASIWLAGQPAGATLTGLFGTDSAPANSPVPVAVISGHVLRFSATGSVSVDGDCFGQTPDGGCYPDESRFGGGPANGISVFQGPASALIGVFLNTRATVPSAVPEPIDFRHLWNFQALSPQLNQVFFIGDGLTGTGKGDSQRVTVPNGATQLFLAVSDSVGSSSGNLGTFTVEVADLGAPRR